MPIIEHIIHQVRRDLHHKAKTKKT